MEITRTLQYLSYGEDVRWLKDWLFKNGFYDSKIKKITNSRYGGDTVKAVKAFQRKYNLTVDGIFGENSREKLYNLLKPVEEQKVTVEYVTAKKYTRISKTVRNTINEALNSNKVDQIRKDVVLEALKYATDASIASQFKYPSSLYIRGGNLYNKDLKLNVISESYLNGKYKKTYASYCTNGRLEMMIKAVKDNPKITGADCSGGIIGILRKFKLISKSTDATANGLCGSGYSKTINKVDLVAGDFVGTNGHICLYVGGGYMVEWAGGEYGCQISKVSDRRCYSYTKKKLRKLGTCARYRRPKIYK